jgi:predicted dehydrogenase
LTILVAHSPIRIGIIGCGEVTQILHLPALQQLRDKFVVTAVCDASPRVLDAIASGIGAQVKAYADYRDLVGCAEVDVVLVANPDIYHADCAIAAMEAGKHVLVEKPMCMTLAEADRMQTAQDKTGCIVQVGYMRRFAGAFLEAVKLIASHRHLVRYARVHDFFGDNSAVVKATSSVVRATDLAQDVVAELKDVRLERILEAAGSSDPRMQMSYSVLLGLSTHDISAMRELLGRPERVLYAARRYDGRNITAAFDYGDFICEFATGMDDLPRFETYIEVYLQDKVVRLDYGHPYIRNLPARLTITEPAGDCGVQQTSSYLSRIDTFVVEWASFHDSLQGGAPPKTSIADSRADLELLAEMIGHITVEAWSPAEQQGKGA